MRYLINPQVTALQAQTGREAVAASKVARESKDMAAIGGGSDALYVRGEGEAVNIATAGGKTFFRQNEKWVESDRDDKKPVLKIQRFSEAYFALLKIRPEFGKYLALGENVSFDAGKVTVEIAVEGKEKLTEVELNQYFK